VPLGFTGAPCRPALALEALAGVRVIGAAPQLATGVPECITAGARATARASAGGGAGACLDDVDGAAHGQRDARATVPVAVHHLPPTIRQLATLGVQTQRLPAGPQTHPHSLHRRLRQRSTQPGEVGRTLRIAGTSSQTFFMMVSVSASETMRSQLFFCVVPPSTTLSMLGMM
jgi:hypothetical protein